MEVSGCQRSLAASYTLTSAWGVVSKPIPPMAYTFPSADTDKQTGIIHPQGAEVGVRVKGKDPAAPKYPFNSLLLTLFAILKED